jgi:hypothetical protein
MKKILSIFVLIVSLHFSLQAQYLIKNSAITGVSYAGNKVNRIYIPPPDEFYRKAGSKGGASVTIYFTGFSTQGKTALNYAASILESVLPADTKLTILASWEKISTTGVLAQSSTTNFIGGWEIDAVNPKSIYPIALAEKIAGKSLNEDLQGDITLSINNSINWYMGTDGKTPSSKYDLVTVALHEICHGLGFFDSMSSDGTLGSYGLPVDVLSDSSTTMINDTIPMIYDSFIENLAGNRLIDKSKFHNYSTDLNSQLIGGQLYFNGPLLSKYTEGSRAKLYAPSTWDAGSSVSHLDESTATLPENSLMTPFIDFGEAIHNPGKYTFSILGDLGWINTRIIHKSNGDTEDHLSQIVLSATIKSDTLYNRNSVGLVFSFDNFLTSDTVFLNSTNSDDLFSTTLNIPYYNIDLQYYFFVEDCFSRLYRSPSLIEFQRYRIFIGFDTVKPVILHTKPDYYLKTIDSISFKTTVTDNIGVDSVYVEYKVNEGNSKYIGLKAGADSNYTAIFNAKPLSLNGGDSILYRIYAIDKALVPNKSVLPETGYYSVHIENIESTLDSYSTDFTGVAADFFTKGFDILKSAGFTKYGLNSKHPYESPEDNNKSIESIALLRHPLKFNHSGMLITFNELVLVEPGETGSLFGSSDFYDYVIVDGSRDFGKTWFNLIDGYDSRLFSSWVSAYNSSIIGNNSTFIGTESMLKKHTIYYPPSDKISAGDTILIRFRLYSDPFANGWGWVIEDLKINPLVDAVEKVINEPVKIYPNPGNGIIKINTNVSGTANTKPVHYSVFNSVGVCVINDRILEDSENLIDISGCSNGIYIITLHLDVGIKTILYSLIK